VIFEPIMNGPSRGVADHWYFTPIGPKGKTAWRRLRIELTHKALSVFWNGRLEIQVPREKVLEYRHLFPDPRYDITSLEFAPRGGLGLYIHKSTASVRNVRMQPIIDKEPQ
jgi:hypothetical protein